MNDFKDFFKENSPFLTCILKILVFKTYHLVMLSAKLIFISFLSFLNIGVIDIIFAQDYWCLIHFLDTKREKWPFCIIFWEKSGKICVFFCKNYINAVYILIASDFDQISLKIAHKKLQYIHLSETFFRKLLSLLL